MWSAPNAQDKIKGTDVVVSTNHVIFLTYRFKKLISLLTSTIFVLGTSESVSYFLEFSWIWVILKNKDVYILQVGNQIY